MCNFFSWCIPLPVPQRTIYRKGGHEVKNRNKAAYAIMAVTHNFGRKTMTNLPKHFNLMIFCVILCIIATATSSSSSSFSSSISSQSNRIRHQQHHQQLHHHRRRNVPRTYGIISQKVDGPVDVCTKKEVEKIYYPSFLLRLESYALLYIEICTHTIYM